MKIDLPQMAAVVVTFHPDVGFANRLAAIGRQVAKVIVVDNGSDSLAAARWTSGSTEVIALGRNQGLASALNIGLGRAVELGYAWAVTFDQDSTPQPDMVSALWRTRQESGMPERIAVVGPRLREERITDEDHRWVIPAKRFRWWFRRIPCGNHDLSGVAFVITSGSLMDLGAFGEIGSMDEGLFIDYIDHDYCLRARRLGFDVMVSARALLLHNLGAKKEFAVAGRKVRPTFHSALRLRYMFRNRWILWRRYAWSFPHWAAFDLIYSHYNLLRILVFEDHRLQKIIAAVLGTWDSIRGRRGKI